MAKRDYYEILGVSKSATKKELKNAYRKLNTTKRRAGFWTDDVCGIGSTINSTTKVYFIASTINFGN